MLNICTEFLFIKTNFSFCLCFFPIKMKLSTRKKYN